MDPAPRVLVCYATAAGSTRGIAERIADRIRTDLGGSHLAGAEVLCRPAGPDLDPAGFDALVVGSAVHNMAWLPEATDFLSRAFLSRAFLSRAANGTAPVWVFSVGGVHPRGPLTRRLADGERARIDRAFPPGFAPRDHRVFGGIVVTTGVPLWGRAFWRLTGGRPGDHRDWPAIEEWADGIAAALLTARRHDAGLPPPGISRG